MIYLCEVAIVDKVEPVEWVSVDGEGDSIDRECSQTHHTPSVPKTPETLLTANLHKAVSDAGVARRSRTKLYLKSGLYVINRHVQQPWYHPSHPSWEHAVAKVVHSSVGEPSFLLIFIFLHLLIYLIHHPHIRSHVDSVGWRLPHDGDQQGLGAVSEEEARFESGT